MANSPFSPQPMPGSGLYTRIYLGCKFAGSPALKAKPPPGAPNTAKETTKSPAALETPGAIFDEGNPTMISE
jgi:hypothetical protein